MIEHIHRKYEIKLILAITITITTTTITITIATTSEHTMCSEDRSSWHEGRHVA